jgi:hypothetical protein
MMFVWYIVMLGTTCFTRSNITGSRNSDSEAGQLNDDSAEARCSSLPNVSANVSTSVVLECD